MLILAVNCGSTSTKLAVFKDLELIEKSTISHSAEYLKQFDKATEQLEFRLSALKSFLASSEIDLSQLDCIVARGGLLPPISSGGYVIDDAMMDALLYHPIRDTHSNLAGIIANKIACELNIPAYIYDGVTTDEMIPIAKYSGIKGVDRYSHQHTLNTRMMVKEVASELNIPYEEGTFIAAHMGGGTSVNIHHKGRIIDTITAEGGAFTPERCGGLQGDTYTKLVETKGIDFVKKQLHGRGGLVSYFGTSSVKELEEKIEKDPEVTNVLQAMMYQTAKSIGALATTVNGKVDAIVLTGGLANSERLMNWLADRVSFLAPVIVKPGEHEMEALARGAYRIMNGDEKAKSLKDIK